MNPWCWIASRALHKFIIKQLISETNDNELMPRLETETLQVSSHMLNPLNNSGGQISLLPFHCFLQPYLSKHTIRAEILWVSLKNSVWSKKKSAFRYDWRGNENSCLASPKDPWCIQFKYVLPLSHILVWIPAMSLTRQTLLMCFYKIIQTSECAMSWSFRLRINELKCIRRPK